jgi:aminoglycoside 6'-N-acetyltransferase I
MQPESIHEAAAALLFENFNTQHGWPSLTSAKEELLRILAEGFARAVLEAGNVLGWIGGLPEYQGRVWELHPIVVRKEYRLRGIGRALAAAFEAEAASRGALTLTLGTDDDSDMTSLSQVDLYNNLPRHLEELRDLGCGHPFLFYQKLGFTVTGVMPDANGRGRPDIYMSKQVGRTGRTNSAERPESRL